MFGDKERERKARVGALMYLAEEKRAERTPSLTQFPTFIIKGLRKEEHTYA